MAHDLYGFAEAVLLGTSGQQSGLQKAEFTIAAISSASPGCTEHTGTYGLRVGPVRGVKIKL
jgi:hypothetical protein